MRRYLHKGNRLAMAPRVGLPAPRRTPPMAPDKPSHSWKAATKGSTFATRAMISGSEEKKVPQTLRRRRRRIELMPEQTIAKTIVSLDVTRAR